MRLPRQLETLEDLLAQAEHYANYSMRQLGRVPPTLFLIGTDGPAMFIPEQMASDRAKDDFATMARLLCLAQAASACVLVLEAWAKFARPAEQLDMTEAPSEALDRREVVVLMGESRQGLKQKILPILRCDNGTFFDFGEPEDPGVDEMKGRFARLLPAQVPVAELRRVAQAMLARKGVERISPPYPPPDADARR